MEPLTALCLVGLALLASAFLAYRLFAMLFVGPQPQGSKSYGDDRRLLPFDHFPIPEVVRHTERYWQNPRCVIGEAITRVAHTFYSLRPIPPCHPYRGGLHYVATWEPRDQAPRAVVLQCVGYGDSNTFLPVLRANRLAERGLVRANGYKYFVWCDLKP